MRKVQLPEQAVTCYHCGERVGVEDLVIDNKHFVRWYMRF
jgi:hypothetical protein